MQTFSEEEIFVFPTSFAQQRLWFLAQWEPQNPFYNIPLGLQLRGALSLIALQQAMSELVARHESLRTTFEQEHDEPVQVIAAPTPFPMVVVDLSGLQVLERDTEAQQLQRDEAQALFNLSRGPLLRLHVLRLDKQWHMLLLTLHHIIADGQSLDLLFRELSVLYQACLNGQSSPLPDLALQYAEYTLWQREWLQGEVLEQHLAYWREQLADLPTLNLPTDAPRPPIQRHQGSLCSQPMPSELVAALKGLSQQEGVTLFMTLLAAFQVLLARYSQQEDIVVGTPIAGRSHAQMESVIGFFVNTLVLRTDLGGEPSFRQLLGRVREVCLGAYAHQDLPFEHLVEALQPQRDVSRSPLFQVFFALQGIPQSALQLSNVIVEGFTRDTATAKFDLSLFIQETEEGLQSLVEYNTDLFAATTIQRLLGHWHHLLEEAVAQPERSVMRLSLLTPNEQTLLLEMGNTTPSFSLPELSLPQGFEAQVQRRPEAIALVWQDQHLSYLELDGWANRLAHALRQWGVGPEVRVALCLERCPALLIGLLAILKAGGVYVPLDPAYPLERLTFMLQDTQTLVLLTQKQLLENLPDIDGRIVCLDSHWSIISHQSSDPLVAQICPHNLAYVVYTSGSTGRPKGIAMSHGAIANLIFWSSQSTPLRATARTLQYASPSFDVSLQELFLTWICGGTVVLISTEARRDMEEVASTLCFEAIERLFMPFVALQQLAQIVERKPLPFLYLQEITQSGEALQMTDSIVALLKTLEGCIVRNEYGPSETHGVTVFYVQDLAEKLPPIGRPSANAQVYLLDRFLQLVPQGVVGELYIGGAGLARGYLNRGEWTAQRFVPSPFGQAGERLYRTGDLARYRADGLLEYQGRVDTQVKLRGYRIELGEIEAVLSQHPAVQEAVVLLREDHPDDQRLVAYLLSSSQPAPSAREVRAWLKERVPDYLLPTAYVWLERFPLTPNGKMDRRALPAPGEVTTDEREAEVVALTPTEELLSSIWPQVLGLPRLGRQENFFELGGHSLRATHLLMRIRELFQVELPLRAIFEAPTIAQLAQRIDETQRRASGLSLPSLVPQRHSQRVPLSFAQQRLWFLAQWEPETPFYNIPLGLHLRGRLSLLALEQAMSELVARHESLRTSFELEQDKPVQVIAAPAAFPMLVVDLYGLAVQEREAEAQRLQRQEAQTPFKLSRGPLVRLFVLRLEEQWHGLLLTLHHIIADGWSLELLFRELSVLYQAAREGQPSPLPALAVQYADYTLWQREWLQGELLEQHLAYWREQLAALPTLSLPTDYARPTLQRHRGAGCSQPLPSALVAALKKLSQQEGTTLFMTLLAAFQVLLARYSQQEDIVVGTPIAGRTHAQMEDMIGCFINTLVLRTDLGGEPSFRQLLRRVREVCLGAYAHQDLPFEYLVEALQPQRDISHSPLFQVLFALQNGALPTVEFPGVVARLVETDNGTAKFDLSLAMIEAEDDQTLVSYLEYNTDLFEEATIQRLLGHWQRLLEGIVENADRTLNELPLLTEQEYRQICIEWNATRREYNQNVCIHQLFEAQVEQTSDNIAVLFEDQQLTYCELNWRADQLAYRLQMLGVGAEVLVGISVERSLELIIGILGILKAGGVYVPLDPVYPSERLAALLEDTQVPILLTQSWLVARFQNYSGRTICLDEERGNAIEKSPITLHTVTPDNLAYIIHTSGSTGKPKGVMIQHRAVCNHLLWKQEMLPLSSEDRLLQFASSGFDISVWEIFGPLLAGASVVLVSSENYADIDYLVQIIARQQVTVLHFIPSLLRMFLEAFNRDTKTCLRLVLSGGEPLSFELQGRFFACLDAELHNLYGPTEAAIDVTWWHCQKEKSRAVVPIGHPLANTHIYLLDKALRLVPVGVPGELYIGGVNVGRGYLKAPDLTAERFIPDAFSNEPGSRLYRTGDLARLLPDGNLVFLGRVDQQIKLRGFRIELGEIEAVLNQHQDIQNAVVLAREDASKDRSLVAYVVPTLRRSPTIANRPRYRLPNDLAIVHLNRNETDFLYKEIFETSAYLRHHITINKGDCIFDVGANIGLFTLFAYLQQKDVVIYAFEPNPFVFELLKLNVSLYEVGAKLFQCGLSSETKTASFTFYRHFSFLSGLYADTEEDKEIVRSFIRHQQQTVPAKYDSSSQFSDGLLEELLEDYFSSETFTVQLRTLSDIIRENNIERVDLLKINVEKSEFDVLAGINEDDWPKIRQVVVEVHNVDGRLDQIIALLERQGYGFEVKQDWSLEKTKETNYYIYATRNQRDHIGAIGDATPYLLPTPSLLSADEVYSFLKAKLPEYMLPSIMMMESLPSMPNGKVDRRALARLEPVQPNLKDTMTSPTSITEVILVDIWSDILKFKPIGIHANFFDLGGHSLSVTQVMSRIRVSFQIELPLRAIFEAPTIAQLAQRIDEAQRHTSGLSLPSLVPQRHSQRVPLSFAQQRLWFLTQWEPETPLYNIPLGLRLRGTLSLIALQQAMSELLARHESLRTTFELEQGEPVQVIAAPAAFPMLVVDLSGLAVQEREAEAQRLQRQEAQTPFKLSQGPLLRLQVLRLEEQWHGLLLTMHHIVADGWSLDLLFRELSVLYQAAREGQPSPLPALAVQYADYTLWQRRWLQGEVLEQQLAYWREQLAALPTLNLPTDSPRPAVQRHQGSLCSQSMPSELVARLKGLSQQEGVTLFMTLLAAFQVLLARYSQQEDIVVGTPIAGRTHAQMEDMIGCFINTLVLRTDLGGEPSFRQVLGRVREVCLGAYAHQDLPFEYLVEALQPQRDLSRSPLFQVFFALQNTPQSPIHLPGLMVEELADTTITAKFDLSLFVQETEEGLQSLVEYNTDLFGEGSIQRLLGHWQRVLEEVVAQPDSSVLRLGLLREEEQAHLLRVGYGPHVPAFPQTSLLDAFEAQVQRRPEAVALVWQEQQLSYQELDRRANRLAHALQRWGVGPEERVALCLERSPALLIGLLAILKAGGSYVPLDPHYPRERLAFVLVDAQVRGVLTQQGLRSRVEAPGLPLLCLDEQGSWLRDEPITAPRRESMPEQVLYTIYTSGSTGTPKGVQVTAGAVSNFLQAMGQQLGVTSQEVLLAVTTLAFDIAVLELWVPLLAGGRCVLLSSEQASDGEQLAQALSRAGATMMQATPATWRLLLEAGWPGAPDLHLLCGGEALPVSLARQLQRRGASLWNLYGPTETTIWSTCYRVVEELEEQPTVPLGQPIANTQLYLLDRFLQLVPQGVVGELYIGGAGLARGYLNRGEWTAERFVPSPFGQAGERLYRTGDLARYRADGLLEYQGRVDTQVKLRGYRIELGEIETVLSQHPAVQEAVVLLREDHPDDQRLVAYLLSPSQPGPSAREVRAWLKERVPDYLLPAAFVWLQRFPLTPNGKMDRRALPAPDEVPTDEREAEVVALTPTEELLSSIWQQVLGLPRLGRQENFFELGGHSLSATHLLMRVRELFQIELPLRTLFEAPTIAQLAQRIDETQRRASGLSLPALLAQPHRSRVPLSFAQQRLWFLAQWEPENPFYNIPLGLHLRGRLSLIALQQAMSELVARHESLRTTFEQEQSEPMQVIAAPTPFPMVVVDLSGLQALECDTEAQRLQRQEAQTPFKLSQGPLVRLFVLRLEEQWHGLLLTLHHIIADGWSLDLLFRELSVLYQAGLEGQPSPLSALAVQYADYTLWQREWLQGELLEQQLAYWRTQLAALPTLSLPTDYARPARQRYQGALHSRTLPVELVAGIKGLSQQEGVTLFMTLLAAFQVLLARYSQQEDIVVGTPIAGRSHAQMEDMIGCFINTLVLRTDLGGEPSFRQLLRRVREVCLGAYAHQELPFEYLVEALQPQRDLSRSPLFQVFFTLQNTSESALQLSGLTIEWIPSQSRATHFDLSLYTQETEEGLQSLVEYNTDLFKEESIQRLLGHWQRLLEEVVAQPDSSVQRLGLLREEEQAHLLRLGQGPSMSLLPQPSLLDAFEAQVQRHPEAVALVWQDQQLSYQELDRWANRLAHALKRWGVGPEERVALCLERSPALLIGVLGILKAGGSYVPLDPHYPPARLAFVLADAQVRGVLTQQGLRPRFEGLDIALLCLDEQESSWEHHPATPPQRLLLPEQVLYTIYTSGSTGIPKGVQVRAGAVGNFLQAMSQQLGVTSQEVLLAVTTLAFDIAVLELWVPLLAGGRCVLLSSEQASDGEQLAQALSRSGATMMQATPATWRLLLEAGWPGAPDLHLLCGGEALPVSLARQLQRRGASLWNLYGPTETTIWSTCYRVVEDVEEQASVPLGLPIANTQLYLLDRFLQLVPQGVVGELYIGGAGLARGYLNRGEWTAQRFVPSPFGPAGERLYRTGDLARYRADGLLEYQGRVDTQVKLRGYRIELGEIETVLSQHPAVRESVVIAREDIPDDKSLVAYVVPKALYQEMAIESGWQEDQVLQWHSVWDMIYSEDEAQDDPTFDLHGWRSSYTQQPIPAAEMREWVDSTVEHILALSPQRVLEIGCGTGLLLFQIAPHCSHYCGTDFSPTVLNKVRDGVKRCGLSQVILIEQAANDFTGIEGGKYDLIILNSVVQYFPSADYLAQVIEQAISLVAPGGHIFLGDVRSLPLLEVFHTAVQFHQGVASLSRKELLKRVQSQVAQENELTIDPAFFVALQQRFSRVSHAQVQLKRGRYSNELTCFRYDVTLYTESETFPALQPLEMDWQRNGLTLESIRSLLLDVAPDVLRIIGVPNARLVAEVKAYELLKDDEGPETVETLQATLKSLLQEIKGIEPADFWALSEELSYTAIITWSASHGLDCYDVVLLRKTIAGGALSGNFISSLFTYEEKKLLPWSYYTNNPLYKRSQQKLVPELRGCLKEKLPEYMIPSTFVVLQALPLTPNGKIDRRALPAPDYAPADGSTVEMVAHSPTEELLAGLWQQVLGLPRLGRQENFFELGGHSLRATHLLMRIRELFQVELPLRAIFEAPTIAQLAQRIDETQRRASGLSLPSLVPQRHSNRRVPLSFAQQRLWFLAQWEPENPFYNIPLGLHLRGRLSLLALQQAMSELVARHESLRTSFELEQDEPVQVIAAPTPFPMLVVDLSGLAVQEREAEAQRLQRQEAQTPFKLSQGPLLRLQVLRLEEQWHGLLLTLHHIIADGWSLELLFRELSVLYQAAREGQPSPLPALAVQYADYMLWQREWLQGELLEQQLAYWREQLAQLPTLSLPTDYARPAQQRYQGALHSRTLPVELVARLKGLSQQEGVTLFMTLLAAFQVLLARYSQQADIVVGTPIAGRSHPSVEGVIGCFINTLVLRTDLGGEPSFRQLLRRVREVCLGAYAHQDLPFEYLVEALQPQRDLSRSPLFQVFFALQNTPQSPIHLPGLMVEGFARDAMTARFDLSLFVQETEEGLQSLVEYNTDLFGEGSIQRLLGHWQCLLEEVVTQPDSSVQRLGLLKEEEQAHLLRVGQGPSLPLLPQPSLLDAFEAQVQRRPEAVALVWQEQQLSYQELDRRANRLAHALQRWGVGPEERVALCLERSPALLIGVLGILKAGGSYVPLDPHYPPARLAFVLADAQVRGVLTQQGLRSRFEGLGIALLCLDEQGSWLRDEPITAPRRENLPEQVLYTIYTSGSTGTPKGVQVRAGAVGNFLQAIGQQLGVTSQQVLLAVTTLAFDIAVLELWVPLLAGGRCVLLSSEQASDGEQLAQALSRSGATMMQATPATWRLLLEAGWPGAPDLHLLCGGEALPVSLARQLQRRGASLWNLYGPTETTIWSTCYRVAEELEEQPTVPLGQPIANTQLYLLDRFLQLVPQGVVGELYIGGAGLARGYLNRGEWTAERFVPSPFGPAGERLYRTGDLARYRADGLLEYQGRVDTQVKLRGYRIELGEIEAVLSQHPAVQEAVVLLREDHPDDQRLVAYLLSPSQPGPSAREVRAWLKERVPDYLLPAAFVWLQRFPLTPNGKMDRRALPAPGDGQVGVKAEYVAPQNELEQIISAICEELLHIQKVSVHDNFFDLGAHSLIIMKMHRKLQKILTKHISLVDFFKYPTIRSLARFLEQEQQEQPLLYQDVARVNTRLRSTKGLREARQRYRAAEKQEK